jgi:O-antigen/teichoic acid export membrane protein
VTRSVIFSSVVSGSLAVAAGFRSSRYFVPLCAFATILVGLAGRALIDKLLAAQGGGELVARWAQLQSLVDLLIGVVSVGLAQGLTVMVAQRTAGEERQALLGLALRDAVLISGSAAALVVAGVWFAGISESRPLLPLLAVLAGVCGVASTLLVAFWLGRQQQGRVLVLATSGMLPLVLVATLGLGDDRLPALLVTQAAAGIVVTGLVVRLRRQGRRIFAKPPAAAMVEMRTSLRRFIPVGLAIGLLSPLSQLLVRADVAAALQWHEAGLLQAIWRSSEWVGATLAGLLSLVFLPRLSAAFGKPVFLPELRRAALFSLAIAVVALALIYFFQRDVLAFLYDRRFVVSDRTMALFLTGDAIRVASWVILFALLAAHATWWVTLGEVLSLPLFAALVHWTGGGLTLEHAGLLWLLTYSVYLAFNLVGLAVVMRQHAPFRALPAS